MLLDSQGKTYVSRVIGKKNASVLASFETNLKSPWKAPVADIIWLNHLIKLYRQPEEDKHGSTTNLSTAELVKFNLFYHGILMFLVAAFHAVVGDPEPVDLEDDLLDESLRFHLLELHEFKFDFGVADSTGQLYLMMLLDGYIANRVNRARLQECFTQERILPRESFHIVLSKIADPTVNNPKKNGILDCVLSMLEDTEREACYKEFCEFIEAPSNRGWVATPSHSRRLRMLEFLYKIAEPVFFP